MADFVLSVVLLIIAGTLYVMIKKGAPYLPLQRSLIRAMVELADVKKGEKVVDLGSGDGRVVFAFAQHYHGIQVFGFEILPFLVWWSKFTSRKNGMKNVHFYWKDFWKVDLSNYDVVVLFGITKIMKDLEIKLQKELKPGSRVVSAVFTFPNWKPVEERNGVYLYRVKG